MWLKYLLGMAVGWLSLDWESLDFVRTVTARGFKPTNLPISISAWSPVGESTSVTYLYKFQCNLYYCVYFYLLNRIFWVFLPFYRLHKRHNRLLVLRKVDGLQVAMLPIEYHLEVQPQLESPWRKLNVIEIKLKTLYFNWIKKKVKLIITCGGSGNPLANVRKSVYAPGASSGGGPGGGAWPTARKCFARTVTRYWVLGAKPKW